MTDITVTPTDSFTDTSGATTVTWTGADLGTADSTRQILVAGAFRQNPPDSVTIGGVTAPADFTQVNTTGTAYAAGYYRLAVPSGTSGDIVFNFPAGAASFLAQVYSFIGPADIEVGTTDWVDSASSPRTLTNDIAAGGTCVYTITLGDDFSPTFDNATVDSEFLPGPRSHAVGHLDGGAGLTGHVETSNENGFSLLFAGIEYRPVAGNDPLLAAPGSFSVAGQDVTFARSLRLAASAGSFGISGQDVAFTRSLRMIAEPGIFSLGGQTAALSRSLRVVAEPSTFVFSGQDVVFARSLRVAANSGIFTTSGQDVLFRRSLRLIAESGIFVMGGQPAAFGQALLANAGTFIVSGQAITFHRALRLAAEAGIFLISGKAVAFQQLLPVGVAVDLGPALYAALINEDSIVSRLGTFMSPSVHTRRPVPEGANYPLIVVTPNVSISDVDALTSRRPVVICDIITYGEQDSQYRVVEEVSYLVRELFHRKRDSLSVAGFYVVDVVASGPIPAPADDFQHVARAVTLTVRLVKL
jgi:hypothetical protein